MPQPSSTEQYSTVRGVDFTKVLIGQASSVDIDAPLHGDFSRSELLRMEKTPTASKL
jgi:hypothetical protein